MNAHGKGSDTGWYWLGQVLERLLHENGVVDSEAQARRERRKPDRVRLAGHERNAPGHPLRGREDDLQRLLRLSEAAMEDGSGAILLRGQSGIGKTRLLAELIDQADAKGWATVIVTPDVDSTSMPLAALLDAAARADPPLVEREAVDRILADAQPQYWITQTLIDTVQRLALAGALLFVVDDVHWLDSASLNAIGSLMRALEGEQIAWVFASRTGTYRAAHARLIERVELTGDVLDLQPLTHDAAVDVATDLLGMTPGPHLSNSLLRTSFIPLLVVELVRGLREENLLEARGSQIEAVGGVPSRFGASLRERLTHLSPDALRLIQVASLLGRRFRLTSVLAVLGATAGQTAPVVDELITHEVLTDDDEHLAFLHDALREGAEMTLSASTRKALAREVAQARLSAGEPASAVASTLVEAAEPGDERSFTLLREAALELAALDAVEASRLAAVALDLVVEMPRLAARAADLVPLLWAGGRGDLARQATLALSPHLAQDDRARALLAIARAQTESSFDEAITTVDEALALPDVSRSTRAELYAVRALNAANKADAADLRRSLADARAVADPAEDSRALATIDATESVFEFYNEHWDRSLELIAQAFHHAQRAGMRPNLWMPEGLWPAFVRNSIGAPDSALRLIDTGLEEAAAARSKPTEAFWMMVRARVLHDAGRLDDARLQAETVLNLAAELGLGDFANATAGVVLFKVALHVGDLALIDSTRPVVQALADGAALTRAGRWALAVEAADAGRMSDAYELSTLAICSLREPIPSMSQPVDFADDLILADILLAAGNEDALATLADVVTVRAEENPSYPFAAAIRDAVLARIQGNHDLLDAAVERLRSISRPLVLARVLERCQLLCDDDERARRALEEALRIYQEHGASRDASRVLAALRARGVRRRPGQATRTDLLSTREAQVLEHLVRGATTQQIASALFVSPHTVVSHVRHIYAKLGVNSRKALVLRHTEQSHD